MRVTYQGSIPAPSALNTRFSFVDVASSIPVTRVTASPDVTVGVRFYVTRTLRCTGVKFYWIVTSGTKTLKVSLWDASNTRLKNASDATITGSGINRVYFSTAQTLTAGALYRVSAYQTDGTAYMKATISNVFDAMVPPRPFHAGGGVVYTQCTLYGAGDAHPGSTAASEAYAVEPILEE
jgi:hypothetical protein